MKKIILDMVRGVALDFTYYDRKECEDLSGEQLQKAIKDGVVSIDEMVDVFRIELENEFKNK